MSETKILDKKDEKKLLDLIEGATEGVVVLPIVKGVVQPQVTIGKTYDLYDLASLTKVLFTSTVIMRLVTDKKLSVEDSVQRHLPWFSNHKILISDLLTHSAGMFWWRPFFKMLKPEAPRQERWVELSKILREEKIVKTSQSTYSDVGMLTLGFLLEAVESKPLEFVWNDFKESWRLSHLNFHLDNVLLKTKDHYAPTEKCVWRKKIIQGQVHDENTYAIGGIAPHAGLFGNAIGVADWFLKLRTSYLGDSKTGIDKSVAVQHLSRRIPKEKGDWAYGFMVPTKGNASCGSRFSVDASVGHTGFTGTSFWWDKEADFALIVLSNRIYPTRENKKFLTVRPSIHDLFYDIYRGKN